MAGQAPPPLDPGDPRAGDPTSIATWVKIGGVFILVIIVVTVTNWNRGVPGRGSVRPPSASATQQSATQQPAASTGAAPEGVYRIVFEGSGSAHSDRPNLGQTTKSSDDTASWHLEYTYGDGHDGMPDMTKSSVKASGHSTVWAPTAKGCTSSAATYRPKSSVLEATGHGELRVHPPLLGDLFSAPGAGCDATHGDVDPYFSAPDASCGVGENCPDYQGFWTLRFTIKPGQTGTDRKSTRLNSSHSEISRMPSSA